MIHKMIVRHLAILLLLMGALSGCDACKSPSETDAVAEPEPTPTPAPDPEPEVDTLAEARADATEKASSLMLHISDQAQFAAADIEGASHKPVVARQPARAKEPETGEIKNMADFRRVLSENQGAMQNCYERALRRNPNLQGRVSLNLLISSTGKVSEARASGSGMREAGVTECMEVHARTMNFPSPEGGAVRMNIPYVFNPQL